MDAAFSARLPAGCVFSGGHHYKLSDRPWGLDELAEPEVMKVESSINFTVRTEGVSAGSSSRTPDRSHNA